MYRSRYASSSGLGPTRLISPTSTFHSSGKLVQAGGAEKTSQPPKPFRIGPQVARVVSAVGHRPELDQPEWNAVQAGPGLAEKYWSPRNTRTISATAAAQRKQEDNRGGRANDVERPLADAAVPAVSSRAVTRSAAWLAYRSSRLDARRDGEKSRTARSLAAEPSAHRSPGLPAT